jgi:thiamine biosynthesis lipoprotein
MLLVIVFFVFSCQGHVIRISKPLLGTIVSLTFIADDESAPQTAQAVFNEIERIDTMMNPARPGSDVYRLNEQGWKGPVAVSGETFDIIQKSTDVSIETDGCFDITVASIARLWDFEAKRFTLPGRGAVAVYLPLVGYRNILLHPEKKSVAFARPGVKIGPYSMVRGYAVLRGLEVLRGRGVQSAMVEAGGNVQVMGTRHGKNWTAGLRHPRKNSIILTLELEQLDAVATSGDFERFVMHNNRRYHHIINPRTGYPAETFAFASVISKNAELSDAYATAIFVMGLDGAREFLKRHAELGVILADQQIKLYISKKLKDRITLLEQVKVEWL